MSKAYDFIKECSVFFVLTVNGNCPAGRPFGAIMEYNDDLFISSGDEKAVYKQLKENSRIQLLALKHGTRDWLRVNGVAKECNDLKIKKMMLNECPSLGRHFSDPDAPHYIVFQIKVMDIEQH